MAPGRGGWGAERAIEGLQKGGKDDDEKGIRRAEEETVMEERRGNNRGISRAAESRAERERDLARGQRNGARPSLLPMRKRRDM